MRNFKRDILLITIVCLVITVLAVYLLGGINPIQLQNWLGHTGIWAPVIYIILYTLATALLLPSTALNLVGGAIFGPFLGTLWTSIGAITAAVTTFAFIRTVGREVVASKMSGRWQAMDAEVHRGGMFYIFAIRLLPVIPYGLVNCAAGLTSISFKAYVLGTVPGTFLGAFPYVLLGSSGLTALKTGNVLPLVGALGLIGILVVGATWYSHRLGKPQKDLKKFKQSRNLKS